MSATPTALPSVRWAECDFMQPTGIVVDDDANVYVADFAANNVTKLNSSGVRLWQVGRAGEEPGQFREPAGLSLGTDGLYVADHGNDRIQVLTPEGQFLRMFGANGSAAGQFHHPTGLAVSQDGSLFVTEDLNRRIQHVGSAGEAIASWTSSDGGAFQDPVGVGTSEAGDVFAVDYRAGSVLHLVNDGWVSVAARGESDDVRGPNGVAVKDDEILVADFDNGSIVSLGYDGALISERSTGATDREFSAPWGIAVLGDNIYVTDVRSRCVHAFTEAHQDGR